ncbi:hypothetical protein Q4574_06240 [Aliiglaciecola sp. 3_MG-2023]|uniref:hypothetical protein n=1 Tax=Aliiglaciecola sp. 3_MG-2023 TaxID=3062644 RepID=UPI0026E169B2|nr:hypothetical protein [Aliiglaciecola sp. 3_MG-2023]MDO6692875.1 hypothetical protein [Aliiglaciecola sp. 3_MG-2023]
MKKWVISVGAFLLLWISFTLINVFWVNYTTIQSFDRHLNTAFLEIKQTKTYSDNMFYDFKQQLEERLLLDLVDISPSSIISVQKRCRGVEVEVHSQTQSSELEKSWMHANILIAPYDLVASISLDCEVKWPQLLGLNALLAALMLLTFHYLPRPISTHQQHWYKTLLASGLSRKKAGYFSFCLSQFSTEQLQIFQFLQGQTDDDMEIIVKWCMQNVPDDISDNQVRWFCKICQDYQQKDQALTIAIHEDVVEFNTSEHLVLIHGFPLTLPKTPYFYFLWYAQKRLQGDGWQKNPATNRPDKVAALELIQLMHQYGGHGKAINDLEVQGLTSKKLDQNRNKIKEELLHCLGEDLAENYLFESRRDAKSQRYWYRTHFDKSKIVIH